MINIATRYDRPSWQFPNVRNPQRSVKRPNTKTVSREI